MKESIRNKGQNKLEFPSDYTVIDIETTGLSTSKNEIIELSALKIRDNKVIDNFSTLIKPENKIGSFITNLTGITNDMVKDSPSIMEALPLFINFLSNDCIMGHNVNFDINFIYDNLKKHFNEELTNDYVDTMRLSRKYCKFPSNKLSYLAEQFNISTVGHHRALKDCEITHFVYQNIKNTVKETLNTH